MCSVHKGLSMLLLKGNLCFNMARNASQYEGAPCLSCSVVVELLHHPQPLTIQGLHDSDGEVGNKAGVPVFARMVHRAHW